jgi:hypothetical protein
VIAVGRPATDVNYVYTTDLMLQQWGKRIWTFPEVLLAPAGKDIKVYSRGTDLMNPLTLAKNQFAVEVWKEDSHIARQVGSVPNIFYGTPELTIKARRQCSQEYRHSFIIFIFMNAYYIHCNEY